MKIISSIVTTAILLLIALVIILALAGCCPTVSGKPVSEQSITEISDSNGNGVSVFVVDKDGHKLAVVVGYRCVAVVELIPNK